MGVTDFLRQARAARQAERAGRLRAEASNCLAIAVGKRGDNAAALIDEAARLAQRARELARAAE
ncbi:hypothetical protein [Sphingomonas flavalba]|uniref:hypothetical protein n=1 Tax=Sphingomonas flavalba TaxID=2559804 RepID=UPI00109E0988|nr:hypothetical protein [Sphingomonas flavalba]